MLPIEPHDCVVIVAFARRLVVARAITRPIHSRSLASAPSRARVCRLAVVARGGFSGGDISFSRFMTRHGVPLPLKSERVHA